MSTLKTNTLSNTAGTLTVPTGTVVQGTAKAWVNFNGTGTVAIRAAFNVSSITDNGTGLYTINFASPMQDANYAYSYFVQGNSVTQGLIADNQVSQTTSSLAIRSLTAVGATTYDSPLNCVSVFR